MSIPLDRLYHYIESIAQDMCKGNIVIYRFYPHGSKKIEDIHPLRHYNWVVKTMSPQIYCNDQEPLNFEMYENKTQNHKWEYGRQLIKSKGLELPRSNFRNFTSIYDKSLLLHSEQRSKNVELYKNSEFIPVYYWSHAVIARDWFRFAEHIQPKKSVIRTFLIYNRAWSGTREYRLGFADRLIMLGLVDHTLMRVSSVDVTVDKHYDLHTFEHAHWRPHNVIEKYFPLCTADSHSSADFDQGDYETTDIEIVLETLFDDLRLHLTEKTLRPIAMGQPFILAGTYGSLKYLRDYGFQTFSDCWDESYDMMSDSLERMNKITEVMSNIVGMLPAKQDAMLKRAREIAKYNKQHFFSDKFQEKVSTELKQNLCQAFTELETTNTSSVWLNRRKELAQVPELKNMLTGEITSSVNSYSLTRSEIATVVLKAREYYMRTLSQD